MGIAVVPESLTSKPSQGAPQLRDLPPHDLGYAQAVGVAWAHFDCVLMMLRRMKPAPFTADAYLLQQIIDETEQHRAKFMEFNPAAKWVDK
jgi:hypothetical protein